MFILMLILLLALISGFFIYRCFAEENGWYLLISIIASNVVIAPIIVNHVINNGLISERGIIGGTGVLPTITVDMTMQQLGTIYISALFATIVLHYLVSTINKYQKPEADNKTKQ